MATAMETTMPRSGVIEGGGGLKKGPWTQAEDRVLVDHVRRHGEGNWNAVRRETGLQRCGKSCRLRWANHLRPNLRKGPFTPDEERLILRLHGLIGNKWARISSHLPGRTDNEVKNYWNTRLKRRQRAGQSLYPPDVEREIALMRAQNINPFADADGNTVASPFSDPFALPPRPPSSIKSASHSHPSPLINQCYPLLSQMQGMQMRHHAAQHAHPQPAFHHHHHGGIRSPGLPPLPTRPRQLPSNQIETASCSGGGDGLLEALLLGVDEPQLPRPNHATCKAGSMPELMYGGVPSTSDSDGTSQFPPGGQDPHHGEKWDFLLVPGLGHSIAIGTDESSMAVWWGPYNSADVAKNRHVGTFDSSVLPSPVFPLLDTELLSSMPCSGWWPPSPRCQPPCCQRAITREFTPEAADQWGEGVHDDELTGLMAARQSGSCSQSLLMPVDPSSLVGLWLQLLSSNAGCHSGGAVAAGQGHIGVGHTEEEKRRERDEDERER